MFGAIIGDIIGSTYEFRRMKDWDFELFPKESEFTDDSILTIAIADALMDWIRDGVDLKKSFVDVMLAYVNAYPYPLGGYGANFFDWAESEEHLPYNSCGNGSAMRVSPCALVARSLDEALDLAK
ncbi:MAG: ADP-ribosylglycohydrolase family protein [Oscillospiraceae bacterium]|nr:ADP-ribosylglycohydrolase family protein [Oscillospiraceae bacterium]